MILAGLGVGASDIVILVVAVLVGLFTWRARTSEIWHSNFEGEKARAEGLQAELTETKATVSVLSQRPDLERLYEVQQRTLDAIESVPSTIV